MFVKPGPNPDKPGTLLKVRHPGPSYAFLPDEGAEVPENHFWLRRLAHGDVVRAEAPNAEPRRGDVKIEPKGIE